MASLESTGSNVLWVAGLRSEGLHSSELVSYVNNEVKYLYLTKLTCGPVCVLTAGGTGQREQKLWQ